MSGPLKEAVTSRLPWLFQDFGFRVTYHDFSYKEMGNSVVELQSDSLRLRFVRDRGPISVQVASLNEPERWIELRSFWAVLTGDGPDPELEGWGWFVRDHFSQLVELLGPKFPQSIQQYDQRQKEIRDIVASRYPRPRIGNRILALRYKSSLAALLMGPFGWIIAAALVVWNTVIR